MKFASVDQENSNFHPVGLSPRQGLGKSISSWHALPKCRKLVRDQDVFILSFFRILRYGSIPPPPPTLPFSVWRAHPCFRDREPTVFWPCFLNLLSFSENMKIPIRFQLLNSYWKTAHFGCFSVPNRNKLPGFLDFPLYLSEKWNSTLTSAVEFLL